MRYTIINGELYHYGVLGMKWGVHRARTKTNRLTKLQKRAAKYDIQSADLKRKAEKVHAKQDLGKSNKHAVKSAAYEKKAAKLDKKNLTETNEFKRALNERRSERFKYKSTKERLKGERLSKSTGYSLKAMRLSIKSDKAAMKAEKARRKIANDKYYISAMKRKVSKISSQDLSNGYKFVDEWLREIS